MENNSLIRQQVNDNAADTYGRASAAMVLVWLSQFSVRNDIDVVRFNKAREI